MQPPPCLVEVDISDIYMLRALLVTGLAALAAAGAPAIIDPKRDDDHLTDHRCNSTGHAACGPDRECAYDPVYSQDKSVNCTCPLDDDGNAHCMMCLHSKLSAFQSTDATGTFVIFLGGVLAGMSGIGGGGLNVPLLMLVMNFAVWEEAVPLSHMIVFGNAIAQNIVNLQRKHPLQANRPLVDFSAPLLLLPAQLGGNSLGVLIGPSFPSTIMTILASVLLSLAGLKTLRTAVKAYRKEKAQMAETQRIAENIANGVEGDTKPTALLHPASDSPVDDEELMLLAQVAQTNRDNRQVAAKVGALVLFWGCFVFDYYGAHTWAPTQVCSLGQWGFRFFLYAVVVLAVGFGACLTRRSQAAREASGIRPLPGDITWSIPMCIGIPLLAYGVGIVAGLLGLGGGELMAPLLLAIGMLPQVASATSAFMITFTSSADVVHYTFQGVLTPYPGYVVWALCLGFCSALTGRLLAVTVTTKFSHPSIIVFALGFILWLSMGLLIARSSQNEPDWEFSDFCTDASPVCPAGGNASVFY